jgi:NAD(P)-dependent dehydrogenase (short-subunit alcohol dehydrogenase family)
MTNVFADKVVVVTGASAGHGRAVAEEFARHGARVALLARGQAGLEAARASAEQLGAPRALAIPVDVADADAVERAAQQVTDELGPPDVWVNNAMESVFARVRDVAPAEFRRVTEVNYLGYVYGTLAALKRMLPRDRGTIVQVGSALAYRGIPLQAAYCASKHAIQGFHDSLRVELLADNSNVKVTMLQLPAMNTTQFNWVRTRLPNHPQPVPPIYQPEVAARAVVWAAEHAPRELSVGGASLATIWANKFVPGVLDLYLARKGISSQQTSEPIDVQQWQDNLDGPVDDDRDHGAHGIFGSKAKAGSFTTWALMHKGEVGAVVAGVLGLGLLAGRASE